MTLFSTSRAPIFNFHVLKGPYVTPWNPSTRLVTARGPANKRRIAGASSVNHVLSGGGEEGALEEVGPKGDVKEEQRVDRLSAASRQ